MNRQNAILPAPRLQPRRRFAKSDIDEFVEAHIATALFSTPMMDGEFDFLDERYGLSDVAKASLKQLRAECKKFIEEYAPYFETEFLVCYYAVTPFLQAAHDLWLTRNGHLPGFNDGDWEEPAATILTEAAKRLGSCEVEIGDDKKLHFRSSGRPPALQFWDLPQCALVPSARRRNKKPGRVE
jgi:hypothetical protein